MVSIHSVEVLEGFIVRLSFGDGSTREVDLDRYMGGPIFQPLREDMELFRQVSIDPELGTIVWPNGADMDPHVLHGDFEPARPGAREVS